MTPEPPPVTFIDDPHAPEVFASAAVGFVSILGNIVITFESVRIDHSTTPGPVNRVVIARLVMPITGAQGLVLGLNDYLQKQGLDPVAAATGDATRQ